MSEEYLEFDINNYVFIKLTEKGYQHLINKRQDLINLNSMITLDLLTIETIKQKEVEGYYKMQFWDFMQQFGDSTGIFKPQLFSTDIIFRKEDLKPTT